MRVLIIGCISFMAAFNATSQNRVIDSLKNKLPYSQDYQEEVSILQRLAMELWDYNFDEGLKYAQQAYQISVDNKYLQGQVESLTAIGQYYYFTGNYEQSKTYYQRALGLAKDQNFGNYPAYTLIRMGNLFRVQSEYDSAKRYYLKAADYLKNVPPGLSQSSLHHNLGLLNFEHGDFHDAMREFRKSLAIRTAMRDSLLMAESWKQLGIVSFNLSRVDSAEFYFDKVLEVARKMNDHELMIFYHLHRGDLLFSQGSFHEAAESFLSASDLLAKHDFKRYQALVYRSIGVLYEWRGDYEQAIQYLIKSLELNEKLGSKHEVGRVYNNMAWAYGNQGNLLKARDYADRSLTIMKRVQDKFGISSSHVLNGYLYHKEGNAALALQHYDSAITIRQEIGTTIPFTAALSFKAETYLKMERWTLAESTLRQVLDLSQTNPNKVVQARSFNLLAQVSLRQGLVREALEQNRQALQIARSIKSIPELRKALLGSIEIYKQSGQKDKTIRAYDQYVSVSDSLLNAESIEKQAQLDALYRIEKTEKEMENLQRENEMKQSLINVQNERISFQKYLISFFVTISILLLVMAYLLFLYSKSKKRSNNELKKLNLEVKEKNEEIQTQSEELLESNRILSQLNRELLDKQEEVKSQTEELASANDQINRINRDLEETIRKRTEQLQTAYTELDTFFYRSSHDFRRPLTTFLGLAEVASITVKDPNALELFSKVKETAQSLDKMLFKLQSISDIGSQQLISKEVRLKDLVYDVIDSFKPTIDAKKIRIEIDLITSKYFYSNPVLLKIILENLMENAIHFCNPENPYVKILSHCTETTISIHIEDNGQGISEEYQDRVFEMYYRANDRSKGNGLGLYIVKKAVEKLNGQITFKSKLHLGSTFMVTIPLS